MKQARKIPILLLAILLSIAMMTVSAYAATSSHDGVKVTLKTDKSVYQKGESITATITVKNASKVEVTNISLEGLIPEGYTLDKKSTATKTVESLAAGETATLTVTYTAKSGGSGNGGSGNGGSGSGGGGHFGNSSSSTTTGAGKDGKTTSSSDTGDTSRMALWITLLALACGGVTALLVLKKKYGKNVLSLLLCAAMIGSVAASLCVSAEATEVQRKSITVSERVTVGNAGLTVSAVVKYDAVEGGLTGLPKPENPTEEDNYYWDNSTVLDVIDAKGSPDVPTEADVVDILKERGFEGYPITYEYTLDGEYADDAEISGSTSVKRPMYTTYYISQAEEVWVIFVINGEIIANPAAFNLDSTLQSQLLLSENEWLTSYDEKTSRFYVTIPEESAVIVRMVERIDAKTLDGLTIKEDGTL